jgi:PKD repeat protein
MKTRLRSVLAMLATLVMMASTAVVLTASVTAMAAQPSDPGPSTLPSAIPAATTPNVDDGRVFAIAQTGNTMVIGGSFTSVAGAARQRVAAFNKTSGALVTGFAPTVNGDVNAVIPGPTANTVYIGGSFSQVNGTAKQFVALLNLTSGSLISTFNAPAFNFGFVQDLVLRGSKLYVAGVFTAAGGHQHQGLVALNASSGALDASMNVQFTGHHNDTGSGAQAWVGPSDIDVTADGRTMVVIGNFKYADGLLRDQVATVDLSGPSAAVTSWSTTRYSPLCFNWAFDQYVRGVSLSPDGTFFAISATGGGNPGTLCDATARFEVNTVPNSQPTWIDQTGGDTLWGITVTAKAIYTGGHFRWENNPLGVDNPRAGAVPRAGMTALDVSTGRPFAWNPGHVPLGVAAFAFLGTADGVWMGYDQNYIGNFAYRRQKIAFFPYAGGYAPASTAVNSLPGTVYLGGAVGNGLSAIAFDGTTAAATTVNNQGIDFGNWRGAFKVGSTVYYGYTDNYLYSRSFNGSTFGAATRIDPYNDPAWSDVNTGAGDTFRGRVPTLYSQLGSVTAMTYYQGRVYYTLSGDSHLYSKWFLPDSSIIDETTLTQSSSVNLSQAAGMFISNGSLYYGSRVDGNLRRVTFSGGNITGSATVVSGPVKDGVNWANRAMFLGAGTAANAPPTAALSVNCSALACSFNGTGSSDPDGTVASYAWTFGDGATGTGPTPAHTYGSAGTYTVTLTVKDNAGASSAPASSPVTVTSQPTGVHFVGAADAGGGNVRAKQVGLPNGASVGDTAVLCLSQTSTATWAGPTGVAGWTQVDASTTGNLTTTVWVKRLGAGDLGGTVRFDSAAYTHASANVAVYSGVNATTPVAAFAHSGDAGATSHTTPTTTAGAGDFVVSLLADRAASAVTWSAPSGLTARSSSSDTGTSLTVQALVADPNGSSAGGTVGGATATTNVATARSAMWTIVLDAA